jgi:hypothetical protein
MRANTQALINTNLETEKSIKGSVLPSLDRLHKEIKNKSKELASGAQKSAREVEKARNTTQKHIELLGQHTAGFESTGGKINPQDDPYVTHRGVIYRLSHQVQEENNHRNDLLAVQENFQSFEAHVIHTIQQTMEAFNQFVTGQADKSRALYSDMLGAAQRIPPDFEWKGFVSRNTQLLIDPKEPARSVEAIQFPNQSHSSTKPLIEGSLERKSRNKLSWGYQTAYYVVTPSKFLHEFKDNDNLRKDPTPELSIYLPDATIGATNGDKFHIKGKDRSKTMSSKLTGTSEFNFKAHSAAQAEKWFAIIKSVAGSSAPAQAHSPTETGPPSPDAEEDKKLEAGAAAAAVAAKPAHPTVVTDHKAQEAGVVTGGETVTSPSTMSPTSATTTTTNGTALTSPTSPVAVQKPAAQSLDKAAEKPIDKPAEKPVEAPAVSAPAPAPAPAASS